jgi:hypothetical protein
MVDYIPIDDISGNLRGICPTCDRWICRRISRAKLRAVQSVFDINFPHEPTRLRESQEPSVKCSLRGKDDTHEGT